MAKKKNWGFNLSYLDNSVRPQDDFYHYAVGGWLKTHSIPSNESRWGSFIILRHKTDMQVRAIMRELLTKKNVAPHSPDQMVRDLYLSAMDMSRRNALGTQPLKEWRELIDRISTHTELRDVVAKLHRIGTGGLWDFDIDQDLKNSTRYVLYLGQDGLGMPDRDYYLQNGPDQKRVRSAYEAHIEKLLSMTGVSSHDASKARETILHIETQLAKISMTKEDLRDATKIYHKYSLAKLERTYPNIKWREYLKYQGIDVQELVVMQPKFFAGIDKLLVSISIEDWKTYLSWHLINDFSGLLSARFVKQNFAFYGTILSGTQKMRPLWRRALSIVNGTLGELLGQLYVERYFSMEAKKKVAAIVDDLIVAYEVRIRSLDWMSSSTKRKALAKLHGLNRKLGYPNKWRSYRGLVIKPDDFFGNMLRATEFEHKRTIKKLGKPIDREEWFMNPQTVNAYFAPTLNDIVFPAAILQHPFFELSADDAVNYGGMGMCIGHEITHGFDDEGSKFDAHGNLKVWWTKEDREHFEKKGTVLERQFDRFIVSDGLHVNGKLTLGENIADLGGLAIAYDAYQMQLQRTGRKDIDGFTPEQRFFLAYAQTEHELIRPEALKLQVTTDRHAPSEFRVNGPLPHLQEFYEAFDVKKGDKLYRAPNQRGRIW